MTPIINFPASEALRIHVSTDSVDKETGPTVPSTGADNSTTAAPSIGGLSVKDTLPVTDNSNTGLRTSPNRYDVTVLTPILF